MGRRVSELIRLEWQGAGEQQDKEERENTKRNKWNKKKTKKAQNINGKGKEVREMDHGL